MDDIYFDSIKGSFDKEKPDEGKYLTISSSNSALPILSLYLDDKSKINLKEKKFINFLWKIESEENIKTNMSNDSDYSCYIIVGYMESLENKDGKFIRLIHSSNLTRKYRKLEGNIINYVVSDKELKPKKEMRGWFNISVDVDSIFKLYGLNVNKINYFSIGSKALGPILK